MNKDKNEDEEFTPKQQALINKLLEPDEEDEEFTPSQQALIDKLFKFDEDKELDRMQFIFEEISERYNSEKTRFKNIDEKASKIIVFVGILVGLQSSFGSLLIKEIPKDSALYTSYLNAFILSVIFLTISIICGLYAFRIQKFIHIPKTSRMMEYAKKKEKKLIILQRLSGEKSHAIEENMGKIDKKAELIQIGFIFLVLGIITTLIFIVLLLYTSPPVIIKIV